MEISCLEGERLESFVKAYEPPQEAILFYKKWKEKSISNLFVAKEGDDICALLSYSDSTPSCIKTFVEFVRENAGTLYTSTKKHPVSIYYLLASEPFTEYTFGTRIIYVDALESFRRSSGTALMRKSETLQPNG